MSPGFVVWHGLRREERTQTLLMATYFFLVIAGFSILKPLKKALFLRHYVGHELVWAGLPLRAAEAELLAKLLNVAVAAVAAVTFIHLSAWARRERLTYCFGVLLAVCCGIYAHWLDVDNAVSIWTFYLFGDLFNMLMVGVFFAFLNDLVSPERARRTYAVIGLGGVLGGVLGSSLLRAQIDEVSTAVWLWSCSGLCVLVIVIAREVARRGERFRPPKQVREGSASLPFSLAGGAVVRASRYWTALAIIVGTYELVSALIDYQFARVLTHYLAADAIARHIATVHMCANWGSLFVQLFVTGFVMRHLGVRVALSALPATILAVSLGFVLAPVLWLGGALSAVDNALNYSIHQSAKESLYVSGTTREKYHAKAFIDMLVQRAAKTAGLVLCLVLGVGFRDFRYVQWMSIVVIAIAGVWLVAARYAGARFDAAVTESGAP